MDSLLNYKIVNLQIDLQILSLSAASRLNFKANKFLKSDKNYMLNLKIFAFEFFYFSQVASGILRKKIWQTKLSAFGFQCRLDKIAAYFSFINWLILSRNYARLFFVSLTLLSFFLFIHSLYKKESIIILYITNKLRQT